MRWPIVAAAFGLGVACGAALVAGAASSSDSDAKALAALNRLSTRELGGEMMRRVGETFVSDSRGQFPLELGPIFFDVPKPWADWACRVDRYEFTADVVKGRPSRTPFLWDPVKVERFYLLWSKPTGPKATPSQHLNGCRQFRNFDNLLSEATILSAARAYYVIDVAKEAMRSGKIDFKLTCAGQKWPCDAAQVLKDIDLRSLRQVENKSEHWERQLGYALRTDEILAAGQKSKYYDYVIRVDSKQIFGLHSVDKAKVLAIDVTEQVRPFTPTAPN